MKLLIQSKRFGPEPVCAEVKFVEQLEGRGLVELTCFEGSVPVEVLLDLELLNALRILTVTDLSPLSAPADEAERIRSWARAKDLEAPGHFLRAFINAVFYADGENFELLRPVCRVMMEKYPARS